MLSRIIFCILLTANVLTFAQTPEIRFEDRVRIAEAIKIANQVGDEIWKDWSKVPFTLLLLTDKYEFLINHSNPTDDFKKLGYDSLLKSDVYYRDKVFSQNLLATFEAVNDVPTIVVGQPEYTGRTSLSWIFTILHEHFHQYQYSQPDYYTAVNSLGLAGDDNTGMWMLNYNFPYGIQEVNAQFSILLKAIKDALTTAGTKEFNMYFIIYQNEREKFKNLLSEKDYAYFSFQNWQEGVADYTEMKLREFLKRDKFEFSGEVKNLSDFIPLDSLTVKYYKNKLNLAENEKLIDDERVCFYTSGSLEGLILDEVNPNWRDLYFAKKFYLEEYMK